MELLSRDTEGTETKLEETRPISLTFADCWSIGRESVTSNSGRCDARRFDVVVSRDSALEVLLSSLLRCVTLSLSFPIFLLLLLLRRFPFGRLIVSLFQLLVHRVGSLFEVAVLLHLP